jgi:outer membrane protein assembly factor BamB
VEGKIVMIITCDCGGQYQVADNQSRDEVCCPHCGAAAPPAEDGGFQIPCGNHPGNLATHNCMNCGKPLCMECVEANGYYCGEACKAAVAASEPDATPAGAEERAAIGEQVEASMSKVMGLLKKAAMVLVAAAAGWLGWSWFRSYTAPKGQIVTQLTVTAPVMAFSAKVVSPGTVLVALGDSLALLQPATQTTNWTVNLAALEEKVEPPKLSSSEDEVYIPRNLRDELRVAGVRDGTVLLHSTRQLVALDLASGQVKWKVFEPGTYLGNVTIHDRGVCCSQGNSVKNFSLADGTLTCSFTNQMAAQSFVAGSRLVMLAYPGLARRSAGDEEESELTAGSHAGFDPKAILAEAMGKPAPPKPEPTTETTIRFVALPEGRLLGESKVALPGGARLVDVDGRLCFVGGSHWVTYGDGTEPVWKATLPGRIREFAGAGGLIAVSTEAGVVALDANTGEVKWSRTDLNPSNVAVGPDGSVFITVSIEKEKVHTGEADQYQVVDINRGGMGAPMPPYTCLVRLDHATGKTAWGVRNIGEHVHCTGDKVIVIDALEQTSLLANQIMVGGHSVFCLAARTGQPIWSYVKTGDLHHQELDGDRVFVVTSDDPPSGRDHPVQGYNLLLIAGR